MSVVLPAFKVRLLLKFNVPMALTPGTSVPLIVVAPPMVPVPPSVPDAPAVTAPEAAEKLPVTRSVPPLTVVVPLCEAVPERVSVPVPVLMRLTLLEMPPAKVALVLSEPTLQLTPRPLLPPVATMAEVELPESSPIKIVGVPLTRFCSVQLAPRFIFAFG